MKIYGMPNCEIKNKDWEKELRAAKKRAMSTEAELRRTPEAVYRRCRVSETKKALSRIAKICRDNIKAFGPTYKPLSRPCNKNSSLMYGAKKEGDGVTDACREILTEIKLIRREDRRRKAKVKL